MKPLAIAGINLRRLFRQPSSYFFVFIFPMLIILVLGVAPWVRRRRETVTEEKSD